MVPVWYVTAGGEARPYREEHVVPKVIVGPLFSVARGCTFFTAGWSTEDIVRLDPPRTVRTYNQLQIGELP